MAQVQGLQCQEALHLALDMPNTVQGVAAFKHVCPSTNEQCIWISTRSVPLGCKLTLNLQAEVDP